MQFSAEILLNNRLFPQNSEVETPPLLRLGNPGFANSKLNFSRNYFAFVFHLSKGPFTPSVSTILRWRVRFPFSLKTMESLQNGIATCFQATPLILMRTKSQASSQSCRSIEADVWCKRALNKGTLLLQRKRMRTRHHFLMGSQRIQFRLRLHVSFFAFFLSAAPLIFLMYFNVMREQHYKNSFNPF